MDLILALPGLLDVPVDAAMRAPALAALLCAATVTAERDGLFAALAPRYGLARQRDWPLAPLRAAAAGIVPGARYWLRAVPVTLVAGRDDVRVAGAAEDLDPADSEALLALLNTHFASDGLAFVATAPGAWLVNVAAAPDLATHPLRTVVGRPLRALLPSGGDAGEWRRWEQEIEMLLFEHPVNARRETRGLPPANGVWLDEGGTYPPSSGRALATWSDDAGVVALARWAGAPWAAAPASLDPVLGSESKVAVVVARTAGDLGATDAIASEAHRALQSGKAQSLVVVADAPGMGAAVFEARRLPSWRRLFSRAAPPLAERLAAARALAQG